MAKKTEPIVPESYEADTYYEVQFSRVVQDGSFKYLPRDTVLLRGAVVTRIIEKEGADVIRTAVAR